MDIKKSNINNKKGTKKINKVMEVLNNKNLIIKKIEDKYKSNLEGYSETALEYRKGLIKTKTGNIEPEIEDARKFIIDYSPECEVEDSAWEGGYLRGIEEVIDLLKKESINDLENSEKNIKVLIKENPIYKDIMRFGLMIDSEGSSSLDLGLTKHKLIITGNEEFIKIYNIFDVVNPKKEIHNTFNMKEDILEFSTFIYEEIKKIEKEMVN